MVSRERLPKVRFFIQNGLLPHEVEVGRRLKCGISKPLLLVCSFFFLGNCCVCRCGLLNFILIRVELDSFVSPLKEIWRGGPFSFLCFAVLLQCSCC